MLACPLAHTLVYTCCWLINIRDCVFLNPFSFLLPSHQSFFVFFTQVFYSSPHESCHPFFTFLYPFHLPDLLQPACFSACLLSVLPLLSVVVRVSWTDAVCGRSFALLTHGQHHTRTQAIKHVCGVLFSPTRPRKPENILSFSHLTSPLPRCGRDHKPNGRCPTPVVW